MRPTMPSPQEVGEAPELALLVSVACSLEATQVALAASYPNLYEDESELDDDHTETSAYARAIFSQIHALLPLLGGYLASVRRASSPGYHRRRSAGDVSL